MKTNDGKSSFLFIFSFFLFFSFRFKCCLVLCFTKGLTALQGNELRKSEPDAAETAAQEAAAPAAQLASWKTVAHMDWREQVEEQASAGDVATTSQPATAAAESLAVIPAPVTLAVERMLQVIHSTIPAPVTPAVERMLQVMHSTILAPVTPAVERMLQVMHFSIPVPVTTAVERTLQVMRSTILGATFVHCACW